MLFIVEDAENETRFAEVTSIFERAANEGPPFAGDLENETYKAIVQKLRDFNPDEEEEKKEGA